MTIPDDSQPVLLREPGRPGLREPDRTVAPVTNKEYMSMQCPIDNETLVISSRDGIEIDYCPKCRGVWLDRGELDKIIERASPPAEARDSRPPAARDSRQDRSRRDYDDDYDDDDYRRGKSRRKKRGSILNEIFDF